MPDLRWLAVPSLLAAVANPLWAQAVHHVGVGAFPTIQGAVDAAAPGDVVLVDAGVYPSFHVGKPLTITASPSALVQVVSPSAVTITLSFQDRVHLAGLDLQVAGVTILGGIVSMERCTVRTDRGMRVVGAVATLRWSSAGAEHASGVLLQNSHLHASDSTFSTAAAGVTTIEHGAVRLEGASMCLLSLCTLVGAWPNDADAPWPSVALHTSQAGAAARAWLADCTLIGGFHLTGPLGPSLVAASTGPARVRLHRTQVSGLAIGTVATGPVVGLHTPVDMTIGGTFTTTMRGEPGHPLLFYVGIDVAGPVQIPELEQPAFGFINTQIFTLTTANAQGEADFSFTVPNNPALRHIALWWRGLDMAFLPWQGAPVFVTVVQ